MANCLSCTAPVVPPLDTKDISIETLRKLSGHSMTGYKSHVQLDAPYSVHGCDQPEALPPPFIRTLSFKEHYLDKNCGKHKNEKPLESHCENQFFSIQSDSLKLHRIRNRVWSCKCGLSSASTRIQNVHVKYNFTRTCTNVHKYTTCTCVCFVCVCLHLTLDTRTCTTSAYMHSTDPSSVYYYSVVNGLDKQLLINRCS